MKKDDLGVFLEIYGNTILNRVWEFLLIRLDLDFAIGDMAREQKISRPKAYEAITRFERKGYVSKSRIIGRTQMYKLNLNHRIVKIYRNNFLECLKLSLEEASEAKNYGGADVGAVSTRQM